MRVRQNLYDPRANLTHQKSFKKSLPNRTHSTQPVGRPNPWTTLRSTEVASLMSTTAFVRSSLSWSHPLRQRRRDVPTGRHTEASGTSRHDHCGQTSHPYSIHPVSSSPFRTTGSVPIIKGGLERAAMVDHLTDQCILGASTPVITIGFLRLVQSRGRREIEMVQ